MTNQPSTVLRIGTILLAALCSPVMAAELLRFQVYLDDRPIGEHSFRIADSGDIRRVSSRASFDVDILFINAYRYRHSSHEVFRDGCLQEIRSTTDDNGKRYKVDGSAAGDGLLIDHQDGSNQVEGCLMTFAYWDRNFLGQKRLLNSQTGKLEAIRVMPKGTDRIETGAGEIAAKRFDLSAGKLNIELWYNDQLGWVGLASDTDKGRRLTYRRM